MSRDLLRALDAERRKFLPENEEMRRLCGRLVEMGVYEATSKTGRTALQMVEDYGAWWYAYMPPHFCPACNADLRDYENGPPGKREIGCYDRGLDRTVEFRCPDCGHAWPR